jgi:hypothetical protein
MYVIFNLPDQLLNCSPKKYPYFRTEIHILIQLCVMDFRTRSRGTRKIFTTPAEGKREIPKMNYFIREINFAQNCDFSADRKACMRFDFSGSMAKSNFPLVCTIILFCIVRPQITIADTTLNEGPNLYRI